MPNKTYGWKHALKEERKLPKGLSFRLHIVHEQIQCSMSSYDYKYISTTEINHIFWNLKHILLKHIKYSSNTQ